MTVVVPDISGLLSLDEDLCHRMFPRRYSWICRHKDSISLLIKDIEFELEILSKSHEVPDQDQYELMVASRPIRSFKTVGDAFLCMQEEKRGQQLLVVDIVMCECCALDDD